MKPIEVKEEQFNEIVFENRNKEYGAYALRKSYKKRMLIAMSVSLTTFLLAVSLPLIAGFLNDRHIIVEDNTISTEYYNNTNKSEVVIPPPPPPPPTNIAEKCKPKPVIVVDGEVSDLDNFPDPDKTVNKPIPTIDEPISKDVEPPVKEKIIEDKKVYDLLDIQEQPSYPGGDAMWMNFLVQNIEYPILARESGISGTVYLKFVIEPDGTISNISIQRGIGGGCDEEAIRVVKKLANWNPGKQNGNPVRVWLTLPIKFTLQ